jgi:hypothetical protein
MRNVVRLSIVVWLLVGCDPAREPALVELPLVTDASAIGDVETDLGYAVTISEARVAVRDFTFLVSGEVHVRRPLLPLVSVARAHPGHFEGGSVTGELRARFVVDFSQDRRELGLATLLVGDYTSANFTFERAAEEDGLDGADPLLGHTAVLRGTASRDDATVDFVFVIDSPEGRELVGAPFEMTVREDSAASLGFRLMTFDPRSGATLFDGLDFFALDHEGSGLVRLDPERSAEDEIDAYNQLRRRFQTHDHFQMTPL